MILKVKLCITKNAPRGKNRESTTSTPRDKSGFNSKAERLISLNNSNEEEPKEVGSQQERTLSIPNDKSEETNAFSNLREDQNNTSARAILTSAVTSPGVT